MKLSKTLQFQALVIICLLPLGCSLFQRSENAENTESHAHVLKTPAQAEAEQVRDTRALVAQRVFEKGQAHFMSGEYPQAAEEFRHLLGDFPADGNIEAAHAMLGASYHQIGEHEKALPHLKRAAEVQRSPKEVAETLLMMGRSLYALGRFDEAMAVTFELLPDDNLERRLGVQPSWKLAKNQKLRTPLSHQVRAHLLRAQIAAAQSKDEPSPLAAQSLQKGKRLLRSATGYGIKQEDAAGLRGEFAIGELEILKLRCEQQKLPESISEEIYAEFSEKYYQCVDHAKPLLCDFYKSPLHAKRKRVSDLYKDMILHPVKIANQLPPAARKLSDATTRQHFETEMKDFILKSVDQKLEENRTLEECGWQAIY